ncbi:MAG: HD domain-containing protein [Acidobacteriota bacterium]
MSQLRLSYESDRSLLEQEYLRQGDVDRYLEQHTGLIDALIRTLFETYLGDHHVCVLATAGYGRREQFPQSDVDLLVVHGFDDGSRTEQFVAPFLNNLWDTRLALGHQVWNLQELNRLTLDDFEFILALFNGRYVAGSEELGRQVLEEILPAFIDAHRKGLVERIVAATRRRHEQFNNTIYQLEPDLKEAPGGLRDHLAASWLERLLGAPPFLPFSNSEINTAYRFLKRLRILVHLQNQRTDNRLTHAMQEQLIPQLGYAGMKVQAGVESLMKEYFLNARVISGLCSAMLNVAEPARSEHPLGLEDIPRLGTMADVLEAFRISLDQGRPLSADSRRAVMKALPELSESISFPALRDPLKDLLRPRPGLYRVLSELYELGVLELLFPEFGSIKARMIRDFYHKYTVDEHTLIAIKGIEDLVASRQTADARFGTILRDTVVPSHLIISLLLHDVGKGRGGKHTEASARMAARALKRFRFDRQEVETIVFLIRQHLAMSAVIFRRDIDDDSVISRFADLVEDPERLRLLTLLTYADIKAVAPGTLNDWKKDLLWQLYLEAYRKLTLEYGEERIEEEDIGERLLRGLQPDLDPFDFEHFLEGFPTRYLLQTAPDEIYEHYRMSTRVSPSNPLESILQKHHGYYELCVTTPDRKRLFAKIVGLLSYFEMNILRGFAFANRRQTILDIFQFSDEQRFFRHSEERKRFRELLRRAVADEISVEELLRGKEESILFKRTTPRFDPTVYAEDEHSDRYTIFEIIAPDALGLLYRISSQIALLHCDIDLALISTEGDKAVDVFYLRHRGGKLSAELKDNLKDRIIRAITQH